MKYRLTIAYKGTDFCGYQLQPGKRTVQGELTKAAERIFGENTRVTGCSRTDSGVHAKGFVALAETEKPFEVGKIPYSMNAVLPSDISVVSADIPPDGFHPRYSVKSKTYEYVISDNPLRDPFDEGLVCRCRYRLDEELMNRAAAGFVGTHDFSAFMASGSDVSDTVRTVTDCSVTRSGSKVTFSVTGNGFLYNMVRIMAGTLMDVSKGVIDPGDIPLIIESGNREKAGKTAPPCGLYLVKVEY